MRKYVLAFAAMCAAVGMAAQANAQVPQYGPTVDLETAKKVLVAAQAEAHRCIGSQCRSGWHGRQGRRGFDEVTIDS